MSTCGTVSCQAVPELSTLQRASGLLLCIPACPVIDLLIRGGARAVFEARLRGVANRLYPDNPKAEGYTHMLLEITIGSSSFTLALRRALNASDEEALIPAHHVAWHMGDGDILNYTHASASTLLICAQSYSKRSVYVHQNLSLNRQFWRGPILSLSASSRPNSRQMA